MEKKPPRETWPIDILREHIQYAVDLEFWTIPYYMCAMYSIIDRNSPAFQSLRTILQQEMLHLQSISNIANAFGFSPRLDPPIYKGRHIPHLDFKLDKPDPRPLFEPYLAEIGPFDIERINAGCLIEYPEYLSADKPDMNPRISDYSNIGEFYLALQYGASQRIDMLHGGVNQIDLFSDFYRNMPSLIITESGNDGFRQVSLLMTLITDQGEGISKDNLHIQPPFQNTANDKEQEDSHYMKFITLKAGEMPAVYPVKPVSDYNSADQELLTILKDSFTALRHNLQLLFSGENPGKVYETMFSTGAAIQNCWKNGIQPIF